MDLSAHHEPLTNTFAAPIRSRPLVSKRRKAAFDRDGFIVGIPMLGDRQVSALRENLESLMEPDQANNDFFYEYNLNESKDKNRTLFHALGAWRVNPLFHDLIFFKPLIRCAETILSGPVRFWHDQVFVKPAKDGSAVAWHQDYSYWTRTVPLAHLTCWIGLDDSDEQNGCVHYVPGSHNWHLLPRGDLGGDMTAVYQHLNAEQMEAFQPVAAVMQAGQASFHHPMTVHGSFENNSDRPRRGVVINFIRDGVRSNTNEPLLEGIPLIPMGDKLEGQFFPLLSKLE